MLTLLVERYGPESAHPEHEIDPDMEIQTLLYLPDPRTLPMPARVMVFSADVVHREQVTLEKAAAVDDPEAESPVDVVQFHNPDLGLGVRAARYRAQHLTDQDDQIYAVIKYSFPVPEHDDVVVLTVSWPDLRVVEEARAALDDLARCITFEYHPDDREVDFDQ